MWFSALMAAPGFASTFADVPNLDRLVTDSAAVVQGEVLVSETAPCALGLCTTHTVLVERALKGQAPETLEVTLPGGTWGGLTQRAAGFPQWKEGTRVILFVTSEGTVPATGLITVADEKAVDPLFRDTMPATVLDFTTYVRERLLPPRVD